MKTKTRTKKLIGKSLSILAISLVMISVTSCKKDERKLPNISFKTGGNYTSADATVAKNTTLVVGIEASKAEKKDPLTVFDESISFDGGPENSVYTESITGSGGDNYSKDLTITTRSQAGTEKYVFSVVNKDGILNSVSFTLTVN